MSIELLGYRCSNRTGSNVALSELANSIVLLLVRKRKNHQRPVDPSLTRHSPILPSFPYPLPRTAPLTPSRDTHLNVYHRLVSSLPPSTSPARKRASPHRLPRAKHARRDPRQSVRDEGIAVCPGGSGGGRGHRRGRRREDLEREGPQLERETGVEAEGGGGQELGSRGLHRFG